MKDILALVQDQGGGGGAAHEKRHDLKTYRGN